MIPNQFEARPETSCYTGDTFFRFTDLSLNWKAVVWPNSCSRPPRTAKPVSTTLHVYHNFNADSVRITDHHPDSVYVGDSVRVEAVTTPSLTFQQRIRYQWHASNPPGGASHFKFNYRADKYNYFFPTAPGNYEVYFAPVDTLTGYIDTSQYRKINVKAKLVISTPRSDTIFWISDTPQMPQIKCRAHIAGLDSAAQETLSFNWKIKLKYENYTLARTGSRRGIGDWIPNFETDFGGDTLMLDVGVKFGRDSLTAHLVAADGVRVLGRNIQNNRRGTVEAFIDGLTQYEAQSRSSAKGAACYETNNYYQFYESGPNSGLPYGEIGGGGGRGIMQLTFGEYVTRNSLWSWHENVRMGTQACHENYNSAVHNFTDYVPGYQPTALQVTKQILAKYNGGGGIRYFKYYEDMNDFARDTTYCADCGACGTRTGEHRKAGEYLNDCNQVCVGHTPYCYGDGACNCAH
jgi:hypothetical protein